MYYWSRTGSIVDILLFAVLCGLWAIGGILLVSHSFNLKARERLISGLAAGFLLYIVLSNLLAQLLPLTAAYWSAAAVVFIVGIILAIVSKQGLGSELKILADWPQILVLGLIVVIFTLILRGLAIFDDYYHLPMISVMATGDVPPHFYLDPTLHLPYHYGLQVFAASFVRLGGFFPYSAWDISRATVFGLAVMLAWLWIRRLTRRDLPSYLGAVLLTLGGAMRWMWLFIPTPLLQRMGANLQMDISGMTAGGNLVTALTNRWPMDGSGPFPFPYAFASGVLEPLNMQLGATGAMWQMTILLLLLVWKPRKTSVIGIITLSLILASLALSSENVFALVVPGMAIVTAIGLIRRRKSHKPIMPILITWGVPLAVSSILALFQGGYITGGFMSIIAKLSGSTYPMVTTDFQGFSLRWPPAVPSGHFGPLSLLDPGQIVIMVAEAGLALILLPLAVIYWLRKLPRAYQLPQALAIGAVISLLFPVIFRYGLDFDITRLIGASLWLGFVLAFPILWLWLVNAKKGYRLAAGIGYGIAILSGVVMLAVELIAMPAVQTTYYLQFQESNFSKPYWNKLEKGAQILDLIPERAVLLFGRASFAAEDVYQRSPAWEALIANPDPTKVAEAGYSYVYMDDTWWQGISPPVKAAYSLACVKLVEEMKLAGDQNRWLYNIEGCKP